MVKNHLKTIAAPKTWPVKRKERVFILRPHSGPHSLKTSISLNFLLIDLLKLATTRKEATYLVNNKKVLIDGRRRKDVAQPVGLFDTISIVDIKKYYRLVLNNKGKFNVVEIAEKEATIKPCKIVGKCYAGKKMQFNLYDGKNILMEEKYKVGDSILLDLTKNKVSEHFKLEKGTTIFLTGGKHLGEIGTVEDIVGNKILYKKGSEVHETLKKYSFAIGKNKASVTLQ